MSIRIYHSTRGANLKEYFDFFISDNDKKDSSLTISKLPKLSTPKSEVNSDVLLISNQNLFNEYFNGVDLNNLVVQINDSDKSVVCLDLTSFNADMLIDFISSFFTMFTFDRLNQNNVVFVIDSLHKKVVLELFLECLYIRAFNKESIAFLEYAALVTASSRVTRVFFRMSMKLKGFFSWVRNVG